MLNAAAAWVLRYGRVGSDFSNRHQPADGIIDIKTVGFPVRKVLSNLANSAFRAGDNFGKALQSADFPFEGQLTLFPYDTMKRLHFGISIGRNLAHPNRESQPTRSHEHSPEQKSSGGLFPSMDLATIAQRNE
jgi:hypothetical protein